jgi:glycosyltransferase involved in cell wall biosynthesis
MLLLSHPTGNANVRALLQGAQRRGLLGAYATALGFAGGRQRFSSWPQALATELHRRCYELPPERVFARPQLESVRLICRKLGVHGPIRQESGWASVDAVYQDLDRHVATQLPRWQRQRRLSVAYAYEDGALSTLQAARRAGITAAYDLPIAYWHTAHRLLADEAERLPEWEPTLIATSDSQHKLNRKTAELHTADVVVCPSSFVLDSIPPHLRQGRRCVVAEFGSPPVSIGPRPAPLNRRVRFLFAGSMSQRKGLADVFAAFARLNRSDIELVVMGSLLMPMAFYRRHGGAFTYEPTRPHAQVLALMDSCDVLLLPSLVEGRALVQQEAMSRGLPIVVTRNAGGEDLVEEGRTGFLVPIRSPDALADRIAWLADHREELPAMSDAARRMAARFTWAAYADKVLGAVAVAQPQPIAA